MDTTTFQLLEHDWVPNNARLPVIVYHRATKPIDGDRTAMAFERMFGDHGWPAQWRDGVFPYHHYHSTAHEVLGVAAGSAVLTIGGPGGRDVEVQAGDAILLPVGTGHRAVTSSDDFLVVGAYPTGQTWDICRKAPDPTARSRIATLPFPESDPVAGDGGPSSRLWSVSGEG
jgi:uncharacterized protein YjlB